MPAGRPTEGSKGGRTLLSSPLSFLPSFRCSPAPVAAARSLARSPARSRRRVRPSVVSVAIARSRRRDLSALSSVPSDRPTIRGDRSLRSLLLGLCLSVCLSVLSLPTPTPPDADAGGESGERTDGRTYEREIPSRPQQPSSLNETVRRNLLLSGRAKESERGRKQAEEILCRNYKSVAYSWSVEPDTLSSGRSGHWTNQPQDQESLVNNHDRGDCCVDAKSWVCSWNEEGGRFVWR